MKDVKENKLDKLKLLLKSIPWYISVLFVVAVISMNLLAEITILSLPFLAVNAGIFVSWITFLILDIVTKHFGAKAANVLSIIAIITNTLTYLLLFLLSIIFKNPNLDKIANGSWSILLASSIAFVISCLTNNYTNIAVGKKIKYDENSKKSFAIRSFVSTFLSQILDNFLFVFLAFNIFPLIPSALQVHWTIWQCIGCSILGAILELLSEVIVSPIGYNITKSWREKGIGKEYLDKYYPNGVLNDD